MQRSLFELDVATRIHQETEREIRRMEAKISRFHRKLAHLKEVYHFTKPPGKVEQMNLFGT